MANRLYRVVIANSGVPIATLLNADNLSFNYEKKIFGTCTFSHTLIDNDGNPDPKIDLVVPLKTEILIYRTFLDGERLIWGGYVSKIDKESSDENKQAKIEAKEFIWILKKRFAGISADRVYTNTEEALIAWNLVDQTQTDTTFEGTVPFGIYSSDDINFGFTMGRLDVIKKRDRTYKKDEIFKLLTQLSEVLDSGEFEVTPTLTKPSYKKFSWLARRGYVNNLIQFSSGNLRIATVNQTIDGTDTANFIISNGEGNQRINYSTDLKGLPVLQVIDPKKDVSTNETLDDYALELLNDGSVANEDYKFSLVIRNDTTKQIEDLGKFDIGDSIRIIYDKDGIVIDDFFRVQSIKISVLDLQETVEVELSNTKKLKLSGFDILANDRQRLANLEK